MQNISLLLSCVTFLDDTDLTMQPSQQHAWEMLIQLSFPVIRIEDIVYV